MKKKLDQLISKRTIGIISLLFSFYINIQATISIFSTQTKKNVPLIYSNEFIVWLLGFFLMFMLSWTILSFNLIVIQKLSPKWNSRKNYISILGSLCIMIVILSLNLSISHLFDMKNFGKVNIIALFFGWSVVTTMIVLISRSLMFYHDKEETKLEKEVLRAEKLKSELNELKSFMNPHFLFNSLNTLNALISLDTDKAILFSSHLSRLYRYVLQSKEKDLVNIEDEMLFLESYEKLLKIRFSDLFSLRIKYSKDFKNRFVPVLSLQTLIENAVKHNEISSSFPLIVEIYLDKNHLVVTHQLNERRNIETSMGNGLSSLSKRCQILLNKDIIIQKNDNFTIKLPTVKNIDQR
ncbi:histidine kinase [Halosquirtibacter laminarini]|uniref:Histidine kinase n=1 Tax=Halosquirtibacter laminarini TaxID=3374600 RepID=A0AC61NDW5_9BACT|nr:histidine kinase [Prolixibacteraceae bacterium]